MAVRALSDAIEVEVLVVGAGPVGATLACRLGTAGVRTAVVDRAALPPMEHPDFDGRAYAIAAGSRALLQDAGVWDALPQPSQPITHIRVSDGVLGRPASLLHLDFQADDVAADAFGWMTEARSLRVALNARLHALPYVSVFAPDQVTVTRDADGVRARLHDGRAIRARLVVAAEGRDSPLREAAGIPVTRFPYEQAGMVCAIAHERPHEGVALEHFLPAGPFAQLPMVASEAGPNISAIVWTDTAAAAARIIGLPDPEMAAAIARRLTGHLGAVRMVGRRWLYPLGALHAHRYVATRLALVGDAAHGIHPIAGQGLNLGMRDVQALAPMVIAQATGGGDAGAADLLARYQRARRPDNLAMLFATDALDRLFSTAFPPVRAARRLGLAAVNRTPVAKRFFMARAMGSG